ncbi:MAG: hypothetical protein AAGG55_06545 [Pseudomonadota bacterium]
MEVVAAILTLIVFLANNGVGGKPASPISNEPLNAEHNSAQVEGQSFPMCQNLKVLYRDLTVPHAHAVDTPQPDLHKASE